MNPLLEAAQARAREGAYLLPVWWTAQAGVCQCPKGRSCPSPGKHPLLEHGLLDASTNSITIERWWQRWPLANLAERTDEIHRIDIDLPEVAEALAQDTALPNETEVVRTPRGGLHIAVVSTHPVQGGPLYLQDGRRLGDLKAAGGYVLVPPSSIGDRHYRSLSPDHGQVMTVDDPRLWLAQVLPAFGYALGDEGHSARQYAALAGTIHEGEGRHDALVSYAGHVWVEGMCGETLADLLQVINERQCRPPLPADELTAIADHFVARRERRSPSSTGTHYPAAVPPQLGPPSNGQRFSPIPVSFPRTDSGNAELFARLYGHRLRYDHRRKRWLLWIDHWWKPDVDEEVLRVAKEATRRRYDAAPDQFHDPDEFKAEAKLAISSESRMRLEAMLALAQAERPIADSGDGWDADPWLLAVANGVVDLHTGALREGRPDDRITMHSPVPYDPEARCQRWLAFLREVFGDDDELLDFIWRACAYSLTGLTNEECHFLCFGSGCNGKGTFNRVQRDILGDYAANTAFSTLEMSSRNSIPNDLAALYGKRLVTASELNEAVRLNEARMKMLAGQDPVTARFLHGEYFTFVPNAKFWLAVNHKPIVNDDSTGFWRKIRLIPFIQCFEGRADRNLKDALKSEYPGILAWMVDGCLEWQRRGLDPPPSVRAATEQYRAESDPIADFLRDRCTTGAELTARAGELYIAYQSWALTQGLKEREQLTATRFGRLMGQRFPKDSDRDGTFYQGIALRAAKASDAS
ncbi:MAG: phage/plasmid primase, P4 family [Dehalococcoidia bacterium]|nr:phage/plasmid primase, P4 family [Dehalococcoidia bacterium]